MLLVSIFILPWPETQYCCNCWIIDETNYLLLAITLPVPHDLLLHVQICEDTCYLYGQKRDFHHSRGTWKYDTEASIGQFAKLPLLPIGERERNICSWIVWREEMNFYNHLQCEGMAWAEGKVGPLTFLRFLSQAYSSVIV